MKPRKLLPLWVLLNFTLSTSVDARFNPKGAQRNKCPSLARVSFSRPESPDWDELAVPVRALAASLKISATSDDYEVQGGCSATRISTTGRILTAMHCLEDCLQTAGALTVRNTTMTEDGKAFEISYLSRQGSPSTWGVCRRHVEGIGYLDFRIVAVGDCSAGSVADGLRRHRKSISVEARASQQIRTCTDADDFAVLESPRLAGASTQCLPLATSRAPLGQSVFSTGFPSVTSRWEGDSNGSALHASRGEIVRQDYCDQVSSAHRPARALPSLPPGQLPSLETLQRKMSETPRVGTTTTKRINFNKYHQMTIGQEDLIQVTADAALGSSGGALVSTQGEYLGLATVIYNADGSSNTIYECRGSVFYTPIQSIVKKIDEQAAAMKDGRPSNQIFDCRPGSEP